MNDKPSLFSRQPTPQMKLQNMQNKAYSCKILQEPWTIFIQHAERSQEIIILRNGNNKMFREYSGGGMSGEYSGGGMSAGGCLPRGVPVRHSPVNRITDRCKNITLPQLRCGR